VQHMLAKFGVTHTLLSIEDLAGIERVLLGTATTGSPRWWRRPTRSADRRPGPAAARAAAAIAAAWGWTSGSRRIPPVRRANSAASRRYRRTRTSPTDRSAPPEADCPPAPRPAGDGLRTCCCS
jgi:hypothetical protein